MSNIDPVDDLGNSIDVGNRVRAIVHQNPYMASDPAGVLALATSSTPTVQLISHAGALYGQVTAQNLADNLSKLDPAAQRGIVATLGTPERLALSASGYSPPGAAKSNFEKALSGVGTVAGKILQPIANAVDYVAGPAIRPTLHALTWASDQPAHLYRTLRTMNSWEQAAAMTGMAVGGTAAALLAPITGGGSLAVFGAVAAGALAGGTLAGETAAVVTGHPNDWYHAFANSWDGDKTFANSAVAKANDLLGDPRVLTIAKALAEQDYDVALFARDLAAADAEEFGTKQLDVIKSVATDIAVEGTPEYKTVYSNLLNLAQDSTFQEAVSALRNGKISAGRDVAETIGLPMGSTEYNIVSGAVDAAWVMSLDPTLLLGKASEALRFARRGILVPDGAEAIARFADISFNNPAVKRLHEKAAAYIAAGDFMKLGQEFPTMRGMVLQFQEYRNAEWASGRIADGTFSHADFVEMFTSKSNLSPLMQGMGTVRSSSRPGIILSGQSKRSEMMTDLFGRVRSFTNGWSDIVKEGHIGKAIDEMANTYSTLPNAQQVRSPYHADGQMINKDILETFVPADVHGVLSDDGMIANAWMYDQAHPWSMYAGRKLGETTQRIPGVRSIPDVLNAITTMTPGRHVISIVGKNAYKDIKGVTELGAVLGMPSYTRRAWADAIIAAENPAARMRLLSGYMDNALTLTGLKATEEGQEIAKKVLERFFHVYGQGGEEIMLIDGRMHQASHIWASDSASEMVMPDLKELQKVAAQGTWAKAFGLVDNPMLEAGMSKIWKPAVLLRPAFILRAAGDEFLGLLVHGGFGSIVQEFGARNIAHFDEYKIALELREQNMLFNAGRLKIRPDLLTDGQKVLLAQGPAPAHLRGLWHAMAHAEWTAPMRNVMERYGEFLTESLRGGVSGAATGGTVRLGEYSQRIPKYMLSKDATGLEKLLNNGRGNAEQLMLGGQHSWRRMVMGGVDDGLVNAARAYQKKWQTVIMREISASNAGVFDRGYNANNTKRYMVKGDDGVLREEQFVALRHQQRRLSLDDPYFANAVHNRAYQPFEDPIAGEVFHNSLWRTKGASQMDDAEIVDHIIHYQRVANSDPIIKLLVDEVAHTSNAGSWKAAVAGVRKHNERLGEVLSTIRESAAGPSTEEVGKVLDFMAKQFPKDAELNFIALKWDDAAQYSDRINSIEHLDTRHHVIAAGVSTHGQEISPAELNGRLVAAHPELLTDDKWVNASELNQRQLDLVNQSQALRETEAKLRDLERQQVQRDLNDSRPDTGGESDLDTWRVEFDRRVVKARDELEVIQGTPQDFEAKIRATQEQLDVALMEETAARAKADAVRAMTPEELAIEDQISHATIGGDFARTNGLLDHAQKELDDHEAVMEWLFGQHNFRNPPKPGQSAGDWVATWPQDDQDILRQTFFEKKAIEAEIKLHQSALEDLNSRARTADYVAPLEEHFGSELLRDHEHAQNKVMGLEQQLQDIRDHKELNAQYQASGTINEAEVDAIANLKRAEDAAWADMQKEADARAAYDASLDDLVSEQTSKRDLAAKEWEAQLIRWQHTTLRPAPDPEALFVKDYHALGDQIIPDLRARALNAHNQDKAMFSQRMMDPNGGASDAAGSFTSGQIKLFAVPRMAQGPVHGEPLTFEMLLSQSDDPRILQRNEGAVRALLVHDANPGAINGSQALLADFQLAEELTATYSRLMNIPIEPVNVASVERDVLRGKYTSSDGAIQPYYSGSKSNAGPTEIFRADKGVVQLQPISSELTDKAQSWAELMFGRAQQVHTRGTTESFVARFGNGSVPLVYVKDDMGQLVAVKETDVFNDKAAKFFTADKKPIRLADVAYFKPHDVKVGAKSEAMWPLLGPMIEDGHDLRTGMSRLIPKDQFAFEAGQMVPTTDVVRAYRSKAAHVQNVGDGVPNWTFAETLVPVDKKNIWERFVNYGFDKVLGPGIDALARKPLAFHFFQQRYQQNIKFLDWLVDPEIRDSVLNVMARQTEGMQDEIAAVSQHARNLANDVDPNSHALGWTDNQALSWLRSYKGDDLNNMLDAVRQRVAIQGNPGNWSDAVRQQNLQTMVSANAIKARDPQALAKLVSPTDVGDYLAFVRSSLPDQNVLDNAGAAMRSAKKMDDYDEVTQILRVGGPFHNFAYEDWEALAAAERNWQHIDNAAGEYAAEAAINDIMPLVDSHEMRTQFAEYGKGFLPFQYAEENFLRRWATTVLESPQSIEKARLGYMGLKSAGVIRTDENGKDFFHYPGSGLLIDALEKIGNALGWENLGTTAASVVGAEFQTPTDKLLPGFHSSIGKPAIGPIVSLPLSFLTSLAPELTPIKQALQGDYTTTDSMLEQIIPTQFLSTFKALFSNPDGNAKYMAAQNSALAQLQATGHGLPDNATAHQKEQYLDRVRNWSRIVFIAQALAGWITPGPPGLMSSAQNDLDPFTPIKDPRSVLAKSYATLVQNLGIEEGTIAFLKATPNAKLGDLLNPIVYTVGQSTSKSGAPLPATKEAGAFFDQNSDYILSFPNAGPWLLPQDPTGAGEHSQYAYDQQTISDLRDKRTPEEFLNAMLFKQGSIMYFKAKDQFDAKMQELKLANNKAGQAILQENWDTKSAVFKAAHPTFTAQLQNSDAKQRRADVLTEMRLIIKDPQAPQPPQMPDLIRVMNGFEAYESKLNDLSNDRTTEGSVKRNKLKANWKLYLDNMQAQRPAMQSFILTIIIPESGL